MKPERSGDISFFYKFFYPMILLLFIFTVGCYGRATSSDSVNHSGNGEEDVCGKIMYAVKSTHKFHDSRLKILQDTWFKWCPTQTYVFTDHASDKTGDLDNNIDYQPRAKIISTHCRSSHDRSDLCCKMGAILEYFVHLYSASLQLGTANKNWLCLFDDDNYVNVPVLAKFLAGKEPLKRHYLGKSSIREPLLIPILVNNHESHHLYNVTEGMVKSFNFATGGAGICLSKSLIFDMLPYFKEKRFAQLCDSINLPDDVTLGYLIENLVGIKLTQHKRFNSHLDDLKLIKLHTLKQQLTLSYSLNPLNTVSIPRFKGGHKLKTKLNDYSKFYALHCLLIHNKQSYCLT